MSEFVKSAPITVDQIAKDRLTLISHRYWSLQDEAKQQLEPFDANLIEDIYSNELVNSKYHLFPTSFVFIKILMKSFLKILNQTDHVVGVQSVLGELLVEAFQRGQGVQSPFALDCRDGQREVQRARVRLAMLQEREHRRVPALFRTTSQTLFERGLFAHLQRASQQVIWRPRTKYGKTSKRRVCA